MSNCERSVPGPCTESCVKSGAALLSVPICTSTSPQARSFIYSTAPPPGIAAAALAAVDFLSSSEGEERRLLLWQKIRLMHELLPVSELNRKSNAASSAILPRIVGDEQAALDLASALQSEGFLVPAIRYPTVAKGSARLRITVTAAHQDDQIRALCEAIKSLSAIS